MWVYKRKHLKGRSFPCLVWRLILDGWQHSLSLALGSLVVAWRFDSVVWWFGGGDYEMILDFKKGVQMKTSWDQVHWWALCSVSASYLHLLYTCTGYRYTKHHQTNLVCILYVAQPSIISSCAVNNFLPESTTAEAFGAWLFPASIGGKVGLPVACKLWRHDMNP